MREVSAGIIVYRKTPRGVKFLVLYHGNSYWNFAKGKIESEEKSWEAAVREVREETGLKLHDLKFKKNFKTAEKFSFWRGKERVFKVVIFYLAETRQPRVLISDEHEGYGWFTYREAMNLLGKFKDSQRVLTQANQWIKRGEHAREPNGSHHKPRQNPPSSPHHS